MKQKRVLEKINSKYVIKIILNYINDKNFQYKLFNYSKFFQKILGFDILDYQEKFLEKFGLNLKDYLCNNYNTENFDKNELKNNLENDLSKSGVDINIIKKICINYFKKFLSINKEKNNIDDKEEEKNKLSKLYIDIYSPFFDLISKSEIFEQFIILISTYEIEKFNLKNDYQNVFSIMNELNINYSSIEFIFKDINDINYLKEFKINFGQIKKLIIKQKQRINLKNYNYFFNNLFSLNKIGSNLSYLNINIFNEDLLHKSNSMIENYDKEVFNEDEIESKLFENLNNFKSLEILKLSGFNFKNNFTLNLFNLKKLSLYRCKNIIIDHNSCLNIIKLSLIHCFLNKQNYLIKMPKLKKCKLSNGEDIIKEQKYNSIIDFKSLNNLEILICNICDFIYLDKTLLWNVILYSDVEDIEDIEENESTENFSLEIERKVFEKLFSIKTLRFIRMDITEITDEEVSKIDGDNTNVTQLQIVWKNYSNNCFLYNIPNKFPNSLSLEICTPNLAGSIGNSGSDLYIEQNSNLKINEVLLKEVGNSNIKIFCQSFENLNSIDIEGEEEISNIEDSFPIFSSNCQVIFKSLSYVKIENFCENNIDLFILENIYNNIDCLPSLEYFDFSCITYDIEEDFYKKFIKKLLSMKLDYIYFNIKEDLYDYNDKYECYSLNEIKEICSNINAKQFNIIKYK